MKFIFNLFFILLFLSILITNGQKKIDINANVKTISGNGIPYASINTQSSYGVIADLNGNFRIRVNDSDTLKISCVGFKRKKILAQNLLDKNEIILDSLEIALPDFIIKKQSESIKITKEGRILKNEYVLTTNFWHGTIINDELLKNKKIKNITCKIGFRGEPILPFRLGIFSVDERGFPKENLLVKDVIIYPSNHFKMVKIDLEEQNLEINDSKIGIALELINPSVKLLILNKNFTPLIGIGKVRNQYPIFMTNKLNKWVKLGDKHPIFELELEPIN